MIPITVGVPVGPQSVYKQYLGECLDSIRAQTHPADEILLIDDMANLPEMPGVRIWRCPWVVGPACAQNFAVALARNEHVLLMGSDDRIQPWCLADAAAEIRRQPDPIGYYYLDVEYSDGTCQNLPCGGAVVSKTLWRNCGGYHHRSAIGSNDSMLISVFLVHRDAGHLIHVPSKRPPIWHRDHPYSESARGWPELQGAVFTVRQLLTEHWVKPEWT